jgi:hypothetical protein
MQKFDAEFKLRINSQNEYLFQIINKSIYLFKPKSTQFCDISTIKEKLMNKTYDIW